MTEVFDQRVKGYDKLKRTWNEENEDAERRDQMQTVINRESPQRSVLNKGKKSSNTSTNLSVKE